MPCWACSFSWKCRNVEIRVLLPVEEQHLAHHVHGHPFGRGALAAPIKEPVIALALIPLFPPAPLAIGDPQDLRRLVPLQPPVNGSQDHLLHLHRPLHRSAGVHGVLHEGPPFEVPA